jgi:hypothetical protein
MRCSRSFKFVQVLRVAVALALVATASDLAMAQVITSPAPNSVTVVRPWQDYATHELRDAWDMRQRTDVGFFVWGVDQPEANMTGKKMTTDQWGNRVFRGNPVVPPGSPFSSDPGLFLLDPLFSSGSSLGKIGSNFRIDTTKYQWLLVKMKVENEVKAINFGTLGLTAPPQMQVYWSRDSIFSIYADPINGRTLGGQLTMVNGADAQVGIPFTPIVPGCNGFITGCGSMEGGRYVLHMVDLSNPFQLAALGTGFTRWKNVNDPTDDSSIDWGATPGLTSDSLRFDPAQPGNVTGQIEIDWARLVATDMLTFPNMLEWTGGALYDVVISEEADCGADGGTNPGNYTVIAYAQMSGMPLLPEMWPNGTYYIGLRDRFTASSTADTPDNREIRACSTGRFVVRDYPNLTFTSPNPLGSEDDFATVHLNNAWDFDSTGDIDYNNWITTGQITTVPAERVDGSSLGNLRVYKGTSAQATEQTVGIGDPHSYLMRSDLRGLHKRIDATKYRLFTTDIGINRSRSIATGSHLRLIWHVAGETWNTLGVPSVVADAENVSNDLVVRHMQVDATRNEDIYSTRYVFDRIQADMADRVKFPLETDPGADTSPSRTGWKNGAVQCASGAGCATARIAPFERQGIDNFRIDYHEFSAPTEFYVSQVRLAAHERTSPSFTITWTSEMPDVLASGESASTWRVALYAVRIQPESAPGAGDESPMTPATNVCTTSPGTLTFELTNPASRPTLASGTFTWNTPTTGLTPGALYFVCAGLVMPGDSTPSVFNFSTWPVIYDPSASATLAPRLFLDRTELRMSAKHTGAITPPNLSSKTAAQTVTVTQVGGTSAVGWTVDVCQNYDPNNPPTCSNSLDYLQITPVTGSGTGTFTVQLKDSSVLPLSTGGSTLGVVLRVRETTSGATSNSPQYVQLFITIKGPSEPTTAPVGQVDSPAQLATGVQGAVGVTGWVVDDVGIQHVKIYRNCLSFDNPASCQTILSGTAQEANVVLVGDAAFVPGARPDVEAAFSTLPQSNQAGWGYLMLTNMLPHIPNEAGFGGQGTLLLYAVATDIEGNQKLLGRTPSDSTATTFTMANDSIAKPFGSLDTPSQGGPASSVFANFGWVLTPDSNTTAGSGDILVPTDGSTITVYVDGVALGNVTYNQCRGAVTGGYCLDDVANIFGNTSPQPLGTLRTTNPTKFRNLDSGRAAIGSFVIDTRTYSNGMHSIAWGVTDNLGRSEGIGSRNFFVLNGVSDPFDADPELVVRMNPVGPDLGLAATTLAPLERLTPTVPARLGVDANAPLEPATLRAGRPNVVAREFERVELALPRTLSGQAWDGYTVQHGRLMPLPTGSFLDGVAGRFTWQSVPGYMGDYDLVFVRTVPGGRREVLPVTVTFTPRASGESR